MSTPAVEPPAQPTAPRLEWDWADLAFASKKPLNQLNATFIVAPRELSLARFKQIVKEYLPQGNILLGISKEDYVLGLEDQPAFKMLTRDAVQPVIDLVNTKNAYKIYVFLYSQRDITYIFEKLNVKKVVLINGSWYRAFHLRPEYYILANRHIDYVKISPFTDEAEAKAYAESHTSEPPTALDSALTETEMLALAQEAAKQSLDFGGFQTGVALGRQVGDQNSPGQRGSKYELITTAFNRVVPYQTYAMHHGASRELNFSPMNDLNHYDTNHAEVELIAQAARERIDLTGTTLFINLLPCPTCARMFTSTSIAEFVYTEDHSAGYAIKMLEAAGKVVRRMVL